MRAARAAWALLVVVVCATAGTYVVRRWTIFGFYPAHDLYAYFYPKFLYAVSALADGGRGLLWNPYQNCGQPFMALPQTGLFYPVYFPFLVLQPEAALRAVWLAHLLIGGLGAYALGRAVGARPVAALVGALVFEMGNAMVALTITAPVHCAPFAWMPVALWACERLLRIPSLPRALVLAAVLTVSMLPGMPQTVMFTYQLLGLRILWELVTRRMTVATLPLLLLATALPVGLAAVELVPELEVVSQSPRGLPLGADELNPQGQWGWKALQSLLGTRSTLQPLLLVPMVAAAAALVARETRRAALFYAFAGALAVALARGPGTLPFDFYAHLPLSTLFRQPARFLWVTSFCLSVLAALGAEALAALAAGGARMASLGALAAGTVLLISYRLSIPGGLVPAEWVAAGLVLLAGAGGLITRRAAAWAPLLVLVAFLVQKINVPGSNAAFWLPTPPEYRASEEVIQSIRPLLGPEDRVHFVHRHPDVLQFRMMPKTASLLHLPAISDYEPLATQRYAELFTFLQTGRPLQSLNQLLYSPAPPPQYMNRRLLDLLATRFFIVDAALLPQIEKMQPPLRSVVATQNFSVLENTQRLPRASFVPRVEIVADSAALLERLAKGTDDLRRVALVEKAPRSGFLGSSDAALVGTVRIGRNEPEHVTLEVDTAGRGFVLLTDQDFPGWVATINGVPAPIERANHAFRLVEVPGGKSTIEFRYAPFSFRLGVAISVACAAVVALLLWWSLAKKGSRVRGFEGPRVRDPVSQT